jgi:hypothetical protein
MAQRTPYRAPAPTATTMPRPIDLGQLRVCEPVERCCDRHPDWPTLTQHLIDAFPALSLEIVVRAVAEAKTATDGMSLDPADALATGELLARQRLIDRMGGGQPVAAGSHASGSAPTP